MKNNKAFIHDNEYYYSIIRKNIRKYRLEQNFTQQDLADMIEMSREYICNIENICFIYFMVYYKNK